MPPSRNHLLDNLPSSAERALRDQMQPVALEAHQVIERPDVPINYAYFPSSGVISVLAENLQHQSLEVGLVGNDGMTGLPIVLADDRSPNRAFVQIAGEGHRVDADALRKLMREHESIQRRLLRYAHAYLVQVAQSALAAGQYALQQRLARWILMCHDRHNADEMSLTHESMSLMLGVRRAGVTNALHALEGEGALRSERGHVVIRDRRILEAMADKSYGIAERELQRLMQSPP